MATDDEIPPNVAAASERLATHERPRAPLHRPLVFQEIIKNHDAQADIFARGDGISHEDWRHLRALRDDMRLNLRPSAERALKWNEDKGSPSAPGAKR